MYRNVTMNDLLGFYWGYLRLNDDYAAFQVSNVKARIKEYLVAKSGIAIW